jgi:hypothetical protein
MGIIPIDEKLQVSDELSDLIIGLITNQRQKLPKPSIQSLLLAKARPGIDPNLVASSVTSRFAEAGIPTGPLQDGSLNSFEIYTNILCEELTFAIQEDMRVDILIDVGQQLTAFGANAGGPVVSYGSNITPWLGTGIGV